MMTCRFWKQMGLAAVCAAVLLTAATDAAAAPAAGSSPDREFAYCTANTGRAHELSQYRITQAGTLQPLKPPAIPLDARPWPPFAAPGHRAFYLPLKGVTLQYRILKDGALSPLSPPSVPARVQDPVFGGGGRFLYGDEEREGVILQYAVSASGALRPLAPPSLESGHGGCLGLVLSPNGGTLYSRNGDCTIGQFRVGSDGLLAPLSPKAVPAAPPQQIPAAPYLVLGPGGQYAYAASDIWDQATHSSGTLLTVFRVRGDGTLEQLSARQIQAHGWMLVHGQTLLVMGRGIDQYHIAADGHLVPGQTVPAPIDGYGFGFTPSGRYAYQVSADGGPYGYRCQPDGSLTLLFKSTAAAGQSVYIDPSGQFLYTRWYGTRGGGIWQFKIGKAGHLTALDPSFVSVACTNLVIVRLPARATKPAPKAQARAGTQHKPAAKTKGKAPAKKGVKGKD